MLVAGADEELFETLRGWSAEADAEVRSAPDADCAGAAIRGGECDVVLVVLDDAAAERTPGRPGDLAGAEMPCLLAARRPSIDLVVAAMRSGYLDVFPLPPRRDAFVRALDRVRSPRSGGVLPLPRAAGRTVGPRALVGESAAMCEVYKQIALVAEGDATVTILGETGTGKELVARAIHELGPRRDKAFVALNCAAVPEQLLESEIFGHERGAFTGAVARSVGRFQRSDGGTLFFDEVADMGLHLQAKVLRALEERVVEPVGGGAPVPIDIRVIAATNRDLPREVEAGRFRSDLFHRLAVVTISLPPLGQRGDDIELLTGHFARLFAERHEKPVARITSGAMRILRAHPWHGNVRELRNAIERAVLVCSGDTIRGTDLSLGVVGAAPAREEVSDAAPLTLAEAEARHIEAILQRAGGQVGIAASMLGIHRNTLARRLRAGRGNSETAGGAHPRLRRLEGRESAGRPQPPRWRDLDRRKVPETPTG